MRNNLYPKNQYKGHLTDALDKLCPCRPCWHIYHFPIWQNGKRIDNFQCWTRANKGCSDPLQRPVHIFYNSKKFQNRKKGDIFKCLRCGQRITLGIDNCDWIIVPFREKKKIKEYLEKQKIEV